jgi:hypothetical protein
MMRSALRIAEMVCGLRHWDCEWTVLCLRRHRAQGVGILHADSSATACHDGQRETTEIHTTHSVESKNIHKPDVKTPIVASSVPSLK